MEMNVRPLWIRTTIVVTTLSYITLGFHCARIGLVSEKYPEEFYKVRKLLPDDTREKNPTFIVYSDNQSSWRTNEKFLKKSNWSTWNMFIFPFYQLYLVGNGIVGTINRLRHIPDYGSKERLLVRNAIYNEAKRTQASFILNVGDITAADGRRPSHWASFLEENKIHHPLLSEFPYLPVIGNHEHANDTTYGFANFQAIFDYPRFYVIEFKDAVLFVVDSNFIIDQSQDIEEDLQDELFKKWFVSDHNSQAPAWLEKQLATYDKSFKIVAMHHPPISFNKHYHDWLNPSYGRDSIDKRQKLFKLFKKYSVQVVLSGHCHLYQHYLLRYNTGEQSHFIVGGGGGTSLREPFDAEEQIKFQHHYKNAGLDVLQVKQKEIYHFFLVKVTPTQLTLKVIEITGGSESPTHLVEDIRVMKWLGQD